MYSSDAAEQIVRMSLEGVEVAAKITGESAKTIAVLLAAVLREEHKTKGKARLTSMIKSGKELKVFSLQNKDLDKFAKEAKRYKKYADKTPSENKLLTNSIGIGLDGKKHRRNLNVLVCGGSGAGKTRFYCKPNIMQANTSFVVLDPKGELVVREKIDNDYKKNFTGEQGYNRNLKTLTIIERSMIGFMPIADIQPYHLENFLHYITKYANNTISKVYAMVKLAYNIAIEKEIVKVDLTKHRDLKCPKSDQNRKKVRGMTDEEQKRFVNTLNEHVTKYGGTSYRLQLLIELYCGMRMGEINALKPEDIHFKKGFIHVQRTISTGLNNRTFLKEGTKTAAGIRDVPISKPLEGVLKQALEEMQDNPDGLIFYDHRNGSVIPTTRVNSFFKTICKKANVKCSGQHSLRHTFATRCIEAGVPALVLKNWLGHTDIHITLDTYADVFDRMNLGAISKFEAHMEEVMANE